MFFFYLLFSPERRSSVLNSVYLLFSPERRSIVFFLFTLFKKKKFWRGRSNLVVRSLYAHTRVSNEYRYTSWVVEEESVLLPIRNYTPSCLLASNISTRKSQLLGDVSINTKRVNCHLLYPQYEKWSISVWHETISSLAVELNQGYIPQLLPS